MSPFLNKTRQASTLLFATLALVLVFPIHVTAQAPTFTILYSFTGGADGAQPYAPLIHDKDGNLYGTTTVGGDVAQCVGLPYKGCGVIFKLDEVGKLTALHTFTESEGSAPAGRLLRNGMGIIYGTAGGGGPFSSGSVFKLDTNTGKFTVLYNFTGKADGAGPEGLVADGAGHFYGTGRGGGDLNCSEGQCCGVVFQLDAGGKQTVLYAFEDGLDGAVPDPDLIRDAEGNLYGTTQNGGDDFSFNCSSEAVIYGCGAVFKLDRNGRLNTMYAFSGGADGDGPIEGLVRDTKGNLYGATRFGGDLQCPPLSGAGCGVIFKVDPWGNETVLHKFTDRDGGFVPSGRLIRDSDGNLYGTTSGGKGPCDCGLVFKLSPDANSSWSYTILHTFTRKEGAYPTNLMLSATGDLYGVTTQGGIHNQGTIFKIHR